MTRILVVDDDPEIARHLIGRLAAAGFETDCASTGRTAVSMAAQARHDLIVLDRMLPDLDGLSVLRALRAAQLARPVLLISGLGAVDERIEGLRAGADDYLPKPFVTEELIARIEALLRRGGATSERSVLACGDLALDLDSLTATRAGRRLDLKRRELQILQVLLEQAGRVVTRSMLLETVWNYRTDHDPNVIEVHVSRLRAKLHGPGEPPLLHTVRGIGYLMRADSGPR
ncbi:MAG: response regulator transcription factor [Pikeienuella sp.]